VVVRKNLPIIGWREWISFPDLGIRFVKAKIDTGARTSVLHAYDISEFTKGNVKYVKFKVHPIQRNNQITISAQARLIEKRTVRDSGGKITERPVISTKIKIGEDLYDIELTLINRDEMGFRMLLGRMAVKDFFLVDPGRSYLMGPKPLRRKR
jgi:hypothetical protein